MPLADKWRAFGWEVREIDGHDMGQIIDALDALPFHAQKPSALIAHTVKGKGVSFAEDTYLWHSMVEMAVRASRTLESEGIGVRVLNMHTIKPLDREAILKAAAETRGIVTAEEHHLTGGLGGAVAELLAVEHPTRMRLSACQTPSRWSAQRCHCGRSMA